MTGPEKPQLPYVAYVEQDLEDGFTIIDFAALGKIPTDVFQFPAYIEGLKRAIFHWRNSLKSLRAEILEWEDEEVDLIAGERAEPTAKQKEKNEPGSLLYTNDPARERELRERQRASDQYKAWLEQQAGLENIINRYETRLSRARRQWKLLFLKHLASHPASIAAAFASVEMKFED
jgi:hypothetical protein